MWLRLIQAESLAPIDEVGPLLKEANELVAIFTTSVKRLRIDVTAGMPALPPFASTGSHTSSTFTSKLSLLNSHFQTFTSNF